MLDDLDLYFRKQYENWAFYDNEEYACLKNTEFETPEIRAQYFYIHNKP